MGKMGGGKMKKVKHKNVKTHKPIIKKKRKNVRSSSVASRQMHAPKREQSNTIDHTEADGFIEEMISMMDEDDINYLMNETSKFRKDVTAGDQKMVHHSMGVMNKLRSGLALENNQSRMCPRSKRKARDDDDYQSKCVEDYEKELIQGNETDDQPKQTKFLLPIKTKDGIFVPQSIEVDALEEKKSDTGQDSGDNRKKMKVEETNGDNRNKGADDTFLFIDPNAPPEEVIEKYKLNIGILASQLLEAPERNVRNLKILTVMMKENLKSVCVCKLLALSLLEIFKDLLPSYKLNPQIQGRHKKETYQLLSFEQSLLHYYKKYLLLLEKMLRRCRIREKSNPNQITLGVLALHCMLELMKKNPNFNFSEDMAPLVTNYLNAACREARVEARRGIEAVFKEDTQGLLTLKIVTRIKQLLKSVKSVCPDVLSVLLALRLKNIDLEAENDNRLKEKMLKKRKGKILSMSRKEHQRKKRMEELEKQLQETKAQENKDIRHKNMTKVAECVFGIIFRILKLSPRGKVLNTALAVLAKFAHCINYEFYQDIVNVINHILKDSSMKNLQRLHCVETIFTILSDEGEVLNIDPINFYTYLYQCLGNISAGEKNDEAIAVLRILEKALITRRRKVSSQRLLAFVKRLCTMAVYMNHGNAVGFLEVVRQVMKLSKNCDILLDIDASFGTGVYQPELPEPEYCSANATALWELHPLCQHYHPYVREMANIVLNSETTQAPPRELAKLSPAEVAERLDWRQMAFRPAVPVPRQVAPSRRHRGKLIFTNDEFSVYLQNMENSVCDPVSLDAASKCNVSFKEDDETNCFTDCW